MSAHVGINGLEGELSSTLLFYETLGIDGVVGPWLDPAEFEMRSHVEETIDHCASLAEREVFDMYYHNHDQEFQDIGGETAFDLLVVKTEFGIELDVGWAAAGGRDPAEILESLRPRGSVVYFKDIDVETGTPVEIGEGDVDLQACADADWFIYEYDHPRTPSHPSTTAPSSCGASDRTRQS